MLVMLIEFPSNTIMQVSNKEIFSITKVGSHDVNLHEVNNHHYCICNHTWLGLKNNYFYKDIY